MTRNSTAHRPAADERPTNPRIAVIGAGVAGSACAAGLLRAGFDVTVFDKSRGIGGRMATRRVPRGDDASNERPTEFDHGCPSFTVNRPRFRALVGRAEALGLVSRWRQRVHAAFPAPRFRDVVVPVPNMPALCRHLLSGLPLRLGRAVTGLQRGPGGWHVGLDGAGSDASSHGSHEGPFDQVIVAVPAAQAVPLLAGHHDEWATALAGVRMAPCWTLMASTADIDWPWDAAEFDRGVLASIMRNDRKPGRDAGPADTPAHRAANWVAHATPQWSLAHLEDDPARVAETLAAALARLLGGTTPMQWEHLSVHRWRFARVEQPAVGGLEAWWDPARRLGVCGDAFGDGSVEAAWTSGDELADAVAASFEAGLEPLDSPRRHAAPPRATQARTAPFDPVH